VIIQIDGGLVTSNLCLESETSIKFKWGWVL